jgi:hypothetical protein
MVVANYNYSTYVWSISSKALLIHTHSLLKHTFSMIVLIFKRIKNASTGIFGLAYSLQK